MSKLISSSENYKNNLTESVNTIIHKYIECIQEYMLFSISNIHIQKNYYFKYIINKGIETIYYVFFMLLMYTKNLDLAYYHACKSFYYYIEFIGQVGDDNHVFLRLTSKDAILFVYKKTIFEINDTFKQKYESPTGNEKMKFETIGTSLDLINSTLKYTYDKYECDNNNNAERNNIYLDSTNMLLKYYTKISLVYSDENEIKNIFTILNDLNEKIVGKVEKLQDYNNLIFSFIKKITKKNITFEHYISKANYCNFDNNNPDELNKLITSFFD